jgi:hypothetical protein
MPTVEEIFEDPPKSWESSDDNCEDDLGRNTEHVLDKTLDRSDRASDSSDEIEPGDWIFMTTVYNPAEFI